MYLYIYIYLYKYIYILQKHISFFLCLKKENNRIDLNNLNNEKRLSRKKFI